MVQRALAGRPGEPLSGSLPFLSGPAGNRTRTTDMPCRHHPVRSRAQFEWNRGELHPDFPRAKRTSSCWTTAPFSDRGGSRTHTTQALNLPALPVGLPGHQFGAPDSNRDARLMRPDRAPARPKVADLGVEPSRQAYEARSGAGPSASRVVTVGIEPTLHGF